MRAELERQMHDTQQAQQQQQILDAQVRTLTRANEELQEKQKLTVTDTHYLAREMQNLQQQYEMKEQELKLAEQAAASQSQEKMHIRLSGSNRWIMC